MRFKTFYLQEAPIAYDNQIIGSKDKKTSTIWGKTPNKNMNYKDIGYWVNMQIKNNVLKDTKQFSGLTKKAISNDNKTMFKWVYDLTWGDQLNKEFEIYKIYKNKYKDLIPRFIKTGKYWAIQEYAKPINPSSFKSATGIDYLIYDKLVSDITMLITDFIGSSNKINDKNLNAMYDEMLTKSYFKPNKGEREAITSKFFKKLLKFTRDSKTSLRDYNINNLGILRNKVVLIDYGL